MYASFIAGGGLHYPLEYHLVLIALSYAAIGSVTAINMYFDRDIDALMPRTMRRPLASGMLNPEATLAFFAALLAVSLYAAARLVNVYFAAAILLGFLFDIVAYTLLLKRRTPLNIVAGAVAGGAPALGGWAAATGRIDVNAVLFSLIVAAWVPAHIWFLATYYREDYEAANVPMLPVVADPATVGVGIGIASMATGYAVVGLALNRALGPLSTLTGLALTVYTFVLANNYIYAGGDKEVAKRSFIRVNMLLGAFYLAIIIEKLLGLA